MRAGEFHEVGFPACSLTGTRLNCAKYVGVILGTVGSLGH